MSFRIAIHERKGSFSDRWIKYCYEHGVPFKIVNCFDNDIISRLAPFDGLLWHWVFYIPQDVLLARDLIQTLEAMGKKVFPDTKTCWHYDNKIGQKYLLEITGAALVPTYVFYQLEDALTWIKQVSFPKVFKLSKGSGSQNVRLINSAAEARKQAKRAFGQGFKQSGGYFADSNRKFKRVRQRKDYIGVLKRLPRAFLKAHERINQYSREQGYIYFQDFMPDNQFDTRITIIGNRAFGFTRNVRKDDFRASGSGSIDYDRRHIDLKCVEIAFDVAERIGSQSLAFDFVIDHAGKPRIIEISYCFMPEAVYNCSGHWDRQLNWKEGHIWPQDAILIDLLNRLKSGE